MLKKMESMLYPRRRLLAVICIGALAAWLAATGHPTTAADVLIRLVML